MYIDSTYSSNIAIQKCLEFERTNCGSPFECQDICILSLPPPPPQMIKGDSVHRFLAKVLETIRKDFTELR